MTFEKIRIEFLLDTDKYSVSKVINDIRNYILLEYQPSSVNDTECGKVDAEELEAKWGFAPEEVADYK